MGILEDAQNAVESNKIYDTVAGIQDYGYGSIDEAVGRQFDDKQGGGFADSGIATSVVEDIDSSTGMVDEAVGRQFDDKQGGGIVDYDTVAGVADHAAGSTDEWVGQNTGMIKYVIYGMVALVVLYLIQPILKIAESQTA